MGAYLRRFRLKETDGQCECGTAYWITCILDNRVRARTEIGRTYGNLEIQLRLNRLVQGTQVEKIKTWARSVLETEDHWQSEDESGEEEEE